MRGRREDGTRKLEKRHKYGVAPREERTDRDGVVHDSKGEMGRWEELRLLEKSGQITALRRQVSYAFRLEVSRPGGQSQHAETIRYVADFVYNPTPLLAGGMIVEDYKGHRTSEYKWKRKLMKKIYGIDILETGPRPRRARAKRRKA